MSKVRVGDVVELEIDGPEMLVTGFHPNQPHLAFCEWFNQIGKNHWEGCKQVFHVDLLNIVEVDRD